MGQCRDSVPEVQDILTRCGTSAIASCYDLESAYFTYPLAEESQKFTGFFYDSQYSTLRGNYYFKTCPFGICNLPSLFSRLVDSCFNGLQKYGAAWFLDDLLQFSGKIGDDEESIIDQHCRDLDRLFGRARTYGFKFSISKAAIGKKYIQFLGFRIGQGQILVSEKTQRGIEAIGKIFKVDASAKDYETIFGFINYSMKFIKNFSSHRKYINKMREQFKEEIASLKKPSNAEKSKIAEKYNSEFRKLFDIWKESIMKTRLQIPEKDATIHVFTDASGEAFGFCAYDEARRIIEFGGKTCQAAHLNYDIICKELQAILEMLHTFKLHIARAKEVIIHVDNKAAVSFLNGEKECHNERSFRLVTRIKMFPKLKFIRVDTKENPSDAPSRLIQWDEIAQTADANSQLKDFQVLPFQKPDNPQLEQFLSSFKPSKNHPTIVEPNESNTIPYDGKAKVDDVVNLVDHVKNVKDFCDLVESVKDDDQTVEETVEELCEMLEEVIESYDDSTELARNIHEQFGPHCGQNRLFKILKFIHPDRKFTKKICEDVVNSCPTCVERIRELPKNVVSSRRFATKPLDIISIDHFTYTTVRDLDGYTSILSIRDDFSRFTVVIPVYSHSIKETIHYLRLFINFLGTPNVIHFDNFFDSLDMREFLEKEGIEGSTSPAYSASSNGLIERVHSDLRRTIPLVMKELNIPLQRWSQSLHVAANYINFSECRSTRYPPMMLMRGHLPAEYFPSRAPTTLKAVEKLWKDAKHNSSKSREMNLRQPKKNKGKFNILPPGTPVYIFLGPNGKTKKEAVVLKDNGVSVRVQKTGKKLSRFNVITVHKSRISRIIPLPQPTLQAIHEKFDYRKRRRNFVSKFQV